MSSRRTAPVDLSIVIVNYRARAMLKECLDSILATADDLRREIFVVDNDSGDGSVKMLERHFPTVTIVQNRENVGFARANNQALRMSRGRYVLLLNPDTLVFQQTLPKLIEFMDAHSDAGLAGPRLLSEAGELQFSMRNYPSLINHLFEALFLHHLFPGASHNFGEVIYRLDHYKEVRRVDWVSGAAMIVRREVLDTVGGFDEEFFLYSEETDWCRRITEAGYGVYYYPGAKIIHFQGEFKKNALLMQEDIKSRRRFYRKHYSALTAAGLGLTMYINYSLRVALFSLVAVRRKNKPARERAALYMRGLRALRMKETQN